MLFNHLQCFLQLEHCSEFVLAGIAARAFADQVANLTIPIFELNNIILTAFYNCKAHSAMKTDIANTVLQIIIVAPFGNRCSDIHTLQVIQPEGGVIGAADDLFVFLGRSLEPQCDLSRRQDSRIESYEVRACHMELAVDIGIHHSDDLLIVRELDLEVVGNFYDAAQLAFQLSININAVTDFQIELIVVIGQSHALSGKTNLHQGLPGNDRSLLWLECCRSLLAILCPTKTANSKCHIESLQNLLFCF